VCCKVSKLGECGRSPPPNYPSGDTIRHTPAPSSSSNHSCSSTLEANPEKSLRGGLGDGGAFPMKGLADPPKGLLSAVGAAGGCETGSAVFVLAIKIR